MWHAITFPLSLLTEEAVPEDAKAVIIYGAISDISEDLIASAEIFAKEQHVICVLKDAGTVVSNGSESYINTSGNSGMATAGSGDVLTGVIAALTASGADPLHAAAYGAYLHGKAGEQAAEEKGIHALLARDIANAIAR